MNNAIEMFDAGFWFAMNIVAGFVGLVVGLVLPVLAIVGIVAGVLKAMDKWHGV